MRRLIWLLTLLAIWKLANSAPGDEIYWARYTFPEFLGVYPRSDSGEVRVDTFVYDGPAGTLVSASHGISGWQEIGVLSCADPPPTADWPMDSSAGLRKISERLGMYGGAMLPDTTGPFTATSRAYSQWDVITVEPGDAFEFSHYFGPTAYVAICSSLDPPWGVIGSIYLDVWVQEFPVPAEQTTWGRIKDMFGK